MPPVRVTLCLGSSCHSRGNRHRVQSLQALLGAEGPEVEYELRGSLCLGRCAEGPLVLVEGTEVRGASDEEVAALVRSLR